ncbi:unnamed protein product [Rotaria sp. Silwood1]|nr:unnamed protein product [Rotaria sp. Silwood1]
MALSSLIQRLVTEKTTFFFLIRQQEPETSAAITAIRTLLDVIKRSSAGTLSELSRELKVAVQLLTTQTDSSFTNQTKRHH